MSLVGTVDEIEKEREREREEEHNEPAALLLTVHSS
jgi:hypothetical protein